MTETSASGATTIVREQPRLLVVGAPRTGFTLLISLVTKLLARAEFSVDPLRQALRRQLPRVAEGTFAQLQRVCSAHYPAEDLFISKEFDLLVGGPKWLDEADEHQACVRKYIGIRGAGDFTLVLHFPKWIMDYYEVIHSHYQPRKWIEDDHFGGYQRFASYRSPLDVLTSATLSLNALTGEYIDRTGREDAAQIREALALYKLSDLDFVRGLCAPQVQFWSEFLEVRDQYQLMRWEDLIRAPAATIVALCEQLGVALGAEQAADLWESMRGRNQTRFHRHNFRRGVIGEWRNRLVNEHLAVLREAGFDRFMQSMGFGPIEDLDRRQYTPFQQAVERCVRSATPYVWDDDPNLFTFAFNKSNFSSTKYGFICVPGARGVHVERSSIKDEAFLRAVIAAVESRLHPAINRLQQLRDEVAA